MNAGKFPTASFAVKQVGGSYYTVRKIIQELQYKSKLTSSDIGKGTPFLKPTMSQQVLVELAMPVSKLVLITNYMVLGGLYVLVHLQSHTSYAEYIIFLVIKANIPDAISDGLL